MYHPREVDWSQYTHGCVRQNAQNIVEKRAVRHNNRLEGLDRRDKVDCGSRVDLSTYIVCKRRGADSGRRDDAQPPENALDQGSGSAVA